MDRHPEQQNNEEFAGKLSDFSDRLDKAKAKLSQGTLSPVGIIGGAAVSENPVEAEKKERDNIKAALRIINTLLTEIDGMFVPQDGRKAPGDVVDLFDQLRLSVNGLLEEEDTDEKPLAIELLSQQAQVTVEMCSELLHELKGLSKLNPSALSKKIIGHEGRGLMSEKNYNRSGVYTNRPSKN